MNDDACFDERVTAVYDEYEDREGFAAEDVDATVDFPCRSRPRRPVLDFDIGTGRIALPLSQRGVPTQGIDLSRAMVAKLKAKPGGEDVPVTIGDFSTTSVDGSFQLVHLICNTIMNLITQQVRSHAFRTRHRICGQVGTS
jgi:Methyltransferase domain